ncbi:MAG: hypothetical protein MI757_20025 [Pirellulales bacterium]|nr:hypothetical protein [Pirellulales bacterium]
MYPTRHIHTRMEEMIKWAVILALAAGLALAVSVKSTGAADPPRRLPIEIDEWSHPVEERDRYGMRPPVARSMQVWAALMDHSEGDADAAIAKWRDLRLPRDTDIWRQVAIVAAHFDLGDTTGAAHALAAAREAGPRNAVVHYYMGLLRLEQAASARDWNDAIGPTGVQLASTALDVPSASTRIMLRLAAMEELEQAIRRADGVIRGEPLAATSGNGQNSVGPTVGDLLKAIGAENFVADSHNTLGGMMLERGSYDHAELHLDAAAELGIHFPYACTELGNGYRGLGRHGDAVRAYAKAVKQGQHGGDVMQPTKQLLQSLRDAVMDGS